MPLLNNNTAAGLTIRNPFQVGRSNKDNNANLEKDVGFPWAKDPSASYLYYDCTVGVMLDSGIVIHNRLPQVDNLPDTLSSVFLNESNPEAVTDRGVSLACNDQFQDIVQRMGHARYWFRLWGQALRVGYKVPIPGMRSVGGVETIPYDRNPQWAYNRILPGANYSGLIVWHAQWSLWYTIASPPISQSIPAVDMSAHINGNIKPPSIIQAPFTQADSNATTVNPLPPGGPVPVSIR